MNGQGTKLSVRARHQSVDINLAYFKSILTRPFIISINSTNRHSDQPKGIQRVYATLDEATTHAERKRHQKSANATDPKGMRMDTNIHIGDTLKDDNFKFVEFMLYFMIILKISIFDFF